MPQVIMLYASTKVAVADRLPVECITPGNPWQEPYYYNDPIPVLIVGACEAECPTMQFIPMRMYHHLQSQGGEYLSIRLELLASTTPGKYRHVETCKTRCSSELAAGEVVDLTPAIEDNAEYYKSARIQRQINFVTDMHIPDGPKINTNRNWFK